MSTIKSSNEHLTLNADGSGKDIKFQSNGSEVASISDGGVVTATTFTGAATDATKLPLAGGTMTGNIAHAGNFTLDVGGTIILDGDEAGNNIHLKDGSTHYGSLLRNNSDFEIHAIAQDKDLVFKGNDGGSVITALTLDMSDGGVATFNAGGQFGGNVLWPDNQKILVGTGADLQIYHDGTHSYFKNSHASGSTRFNQKYFEVNNTAGTESMLSAYEDGAVTLRHDGVSKLATTATGIAVTGGVAIGGTGTANTLDDYEEGTWSPTLSGGTSQQDLMYTKIGNIVHIGGTITMASISGSGTISIGGLPFTSSNSAEAYTSLNAHAYYSLNMGETTRNFQTLRVGKNSTELKIIAPTGNGAARQFGDYSHVVNNSFSFRVSGSYFTA